MTGGEENGEPARTDGHFIQFFGTLPNNPQAAGGSTAAHPGVANRSPAPACAARTSATRRSPRC